MYLPVGFLPQSQILTLNIVTNFIQMRYEQNIHMLTVIAWNSKQALQKSFQKYGPVSNELLTFGRKKLTMYLLFTLTAKTNKLQS